MIDDPPELHFALQPVPDLRHHQRGHIQLRLCRLPLRNPEQVVTDATEPAGICGRDELETEETVEEVVVQTVPIVVE